MSDSTVRIPQSFTVEGAFGKDHIVAPCTYCSMPTITIDCDKPTCAECTLRASGVVVPVRIRQFGMNSFDHKTVGIALADPMVAVMDKLAEECKLPKSILRECFLYFVDGRVLTATYGAYESNKGLTAAEVLGRQSLLIGGSRVTFLVPSPAEASMLHKLGPCNP